MTIKFTIFNKNILSWALRRAGMDASELGFPAKKLESWLDGTDFPTVKQAEEISKKLDVPLPFFCLTETPEEAKIPLPDFRTIGNQPIKNISLGLRKTIEHAQACQIFFSEYLKDNGEDGFPYKERLCLEMQPEEAAAVLVEILGKRERKKRASDAFKDVLNRIENTGVLVQKNRCVLNSTKSKLDPKEFRGFAIFDKYAPLIFINENDATRASLFTLVHEFCHILLSSSGISGLSTQNRTERFCNRTASEYLVPKDEFLTLWHEYLHISADEKISRLADLFCVSRWVILIKARDLRLIRQKEFDEHQEKLLNQWTPLKKKRSSSGPDYNFMQSYHFSEQLVNAAVIAAYSGTITFKEAMNLTKLGPKGIEAKAKELRL